MHELSDVLNHWDIPNCEPHPLTAGEVKHCCRVGDFVLRVYPSYVQRPHVEAECEWTDSHSANLPVPQPIRTKQGQWSTAAWGRRVAALSGFVPGRPADSRNPSHGYQAARMLAHVHRTAAPGSTAFPALHDLNWMSNDWWDLDLASELFAGWELFARVTDWLSELDGWLEQLEGLPIATTHNDFGPVNVLFENDALSSIIDWDFLKLERRVVDIAHSAWVFHPGPRRDNGNVQPVLDFIEQYDAEAAQPVTPAEHRTLPAALRLQMLWTACYDLGRATRVTTNTGEVYDVEGSFAYRAGTMVAIDALAQALA